MGPFGILSSGIIMGVSAYLLYKITGSIEWASFYFLNATLVIGAMSEIVDAIKDRK